MPTQDEPKLPADAGPVERPLGLLPERAERVHSLVNAGPWTGMSEAFDLHMGAACWTDPAYAPDAAMWAAAWKAAKRSA